MSKEDLSRVIGRALLDHKFLGEVHADPAAAAKSIGATLTHDESKALHDVSLVHMYQASASLRQHLPINMVLDQQQQQAQMD